MYGNYNLFAYDSSFKCVQEWSFDNVIIESKDNTISVIDEGGNIIYMISTNCCTVVVMEDDGE